MNDFYEKQLSLLDKRIRHAKMNIFRKLTPSEIDTLESRGSFAEDWKDIEVTDKFDANNIIRCYFKGHNKLGKCSIRNTELRECSVADGVEITNTGGFISRYDIGEGTKIENCGTIEVTGRTSFANGTMVATINEGGGREVPLFDDLSAQLAYITAMYRHRPDTVIRIHELIEKYARDAESDRGSIGDNVSLRNCTAIRNARIEADASVYGAALLDCCTLRKGARIGSGVMLKECIVAKNASVDAFSRLEKCFVGESCRIGSGFSALDSLFFANCHMENGEACSIFAGPYTVSHHKSTLLIAGYFLFFNAGSGANQSNHLFKAGPIHQGINERGCKFASNAYVMLPARNGAFCSVLGRHLNHHDSRSFPFSTTIEHDGKTFIIPANNLKSWGTVRDIMKWPQRDKRTGLVTDRINFEALSPYIGEKIAKAVEVSEKLLERQNIEVYKYERCNIRQSMLKHGLGHYRVALAAIIGKALSKGRIVEAHDKWADIAGMYAPCAKIEKLLDYIETGANSIGDIETHLDALHAAYEDYAHSWALDMLEKQIGHAPSREEIEQAIATGMAAEHSLRKMAESDAKKEYDRLMMTGYGIDDSGNPDTVLRDFNSVRGIK